MTTATTSLCVDIDTESVVPALQQARARLDSAGGEIVLDFSRVRRIDPCALKALEELASTADEKAVKVALRGINVTIYKVLKLVDLTPRFAFLA